MTEATTPALNMPPRTERAANDELDAEAYLNLGTMTTAALRFFQARDYDGAASKLKASIAIIERVKSRRR